jgi:hypothetical protein
MANPAIVTGQPSKINPAPITGTGIVGPFVFQAGPTEGDFSAVFQAVGTLGALSADLQISLDGGTTWVNIVATALVAATPIKVVTPVISGAQYRFNVTGAPTSADFWVSTN